MCKPNLPVGSDGHLVAHVWPGGYPVYYLCEDGSILCNVCANGERESIIGAECNWEDPDMYCDECNGRIESAYAEV